MRETETNETRADFRQPESGQPSRWGGALKMARGFGERVKDAASDAASKGKEALAGAAAKGKEAIQNFDTDAAITAARTQVDRAADMGKSFAGKAAETGREIKERTLDALRSERGQQAKAIALRVLDSEVINLVPFMETIKEGGMAITGRDLHGNELETGERVKLGAKAAAWGAVDFFTFGEGHVLAEGGRLAGMAAKLQKTRHVGAMTAAGREYFAGNPGVLKQFAGFLEKRGSKHAAALQEAVGILENEQQSA